MAMILQPLSPRRRNWLVPALSVLAGAALLAWFFHGSTEKVVAATGPAFQAVPVPAQDAAALAAQLEAKLKEQPDDTETGILLARAYGAMGRDGDAVNVFRRLLATSAPDAVSLSQAHVDLARALGKANDRRLSPEAEEHLKLALQLNPNNVMAHALQAHVSYERGDAAAAKAHWEKALEGVDSRHPFAQQLRQSIQLADTALSGKSAQPGKAQD